ncbi:TetR/AcrR family transcriptional regulator [Paenibacillus filicis]|uniref:TetR/AcrR family transcriptional regulator n=1 Tax=Paenibacillus gyeongsangnamensis TaxID=3388067 RepID=A0ABT4QFB4_9BACL|nr:TetR/AcrR family transcriptional regulator [Paenibacillus filicis]MCZ8515552.1 TetR/AcrR family transcriptional regulator [Paenibacillus filicis]
MGEPLRRPPGRPRLDDSEEPLTETVLQTAIQLFLRFGYDGVSMDQVAKESGVTKATVYYYYANKAALLTASMLHRMEQVRCETESSLKADKPLRERLIDNAAGMLASQSGSFDDLMQKAERMLSEAQLDQMREAKERMLLLLSDELASASQRGEIGSIDPFVTANAFFALMQMGRMKQADGLPLFSSPDEAAEHIVGLLWYGMFPKAGNG